VPYDLDPLNLRYLEDKASLAMELVDLHLILKPGVLETAYESGMPSWGAGEHLPCITGR